MEVSTEKSKLMSNSMKNINGDVSKNGQKLEEVTSFKYQDCLRNGSNCQTKQDVLQNHQLCK